MITQGSRLLGSFCNTSLVKFAETVYVFKSTTGDSPRTVTVSSTGETSMVILTNVVFLKVTSTFLEMVVLKPGKVNVRSYLPTGKNENLNSPLVEVVVERFFLIRASPERLMVTPGRPAPLVSNTTPSMLPVCKVSWASEGTTKTITPRNKIHSLFFIIPSS